MWLFLLTLSIFPPVQSNLKVDWLFNNSKSSKPNRSANLFEKRKRKAFSYLWAIVRTFYSTSILAGPCTYHRLCWNPPPAGEDELAGAASTEGNSTLIPTPVMLRAPISAPAIILSLDNKLFKQFMKGYLEAQVPGQIKVNSEPCNQSLKARFPDLYYSNLQMDYYRFCQQCKDHFETPGAKEPNKILFAALFLHELVIQWWL